MTSYNLRNDKNINVKLPKNVKIQKSIDHSGPKFYNLLPPEIKALCGKNTFINAVKKFLIKKNLYSIDEYINS